MRNKFAALPLLCLALVTGCSGKLGSSPPPMQDPTRNSGLERLPVVTVLGGLAMRYGPAVPAATRDGSPYARRIS